MEGFFLAAPRWLYALLLTPLVAALCWRSLAVRPRGKRLLCTAIRLCICALLLLALAEPSRRRLISSIEPPGLAILYDQSASIGPAGMDRAEKLGVDIAAAVPTDVAIQRIRFASLPWMGDKPDYVRTDATNLAAAIDLAAQRLGPGPGRHAVLFSDGNGTSGDAASAARRFHSSGRILHVIPVGQRTLIPPHVAGITIPDSPRVDRTCHACVTVRTGMPTDLRISVLDDADRMIETVDARVSGERVIAVPLLPRRKGLHHWKVQVIRLDTREATDASPLWFCAAGETAVALYDPHPATATMLRQAIERAGMHVDTFTPTQFPSTLEALSAYDAIVLSDWNGPTLANEQQRVLGAYVLGGGGMLFVGGASVSTRKWHGTDLEQLLPVDFAPEQVRVLKQEAMIHVCYVLDVSGSMADGLGMDTTGRPVTKFQMLKAAVLESLQVLPQSALVSIVAFDAGASVLADSAPMSEYRRIERAVRGMRIGGGTNIVPGLEEAVRILQHSDRAQHVILLTDGVSSEDPSMALCQKLRTAGIKVSTVAVGAESNQAMLRNLADQTLGRFYFCSDASVIPRIFVEEIQSITVLAAAPREPFAPQIDSESAWMQPLASESWPILDAAIPAHTKQSPAVEVALRTDTDQPLLARWHVGSGCVAAFMSDAKATWAARWLQWPQFDRFWACVMAGIVRSQLAYDAHVDACLEQGHVSIMVQLRDAEGDPITSFEPNGRLIDTVDPTAPHRELQWKLHPSGYFEATAPVDPLGRYVCHVIFVDASGTGVCERLITINADAAAEMARTGPNGPELRGIASAGGGIFDPTPEQLARQFSEPHTCSRMMIKPYWSALVMIALLLWPVDTLCRRICA